MLTSQIRVTIALNVVVNNVLDHAGLHVLELFFVSKNIFKVLLSPPH